MVWVVGYLGFLSFFFFKLRLERVLLRRSSGVSCLDAAAKRVIGGCKPDGCITCDIRFMANGVFFSFLLILFSLVRSL